MYKDVRLLLGDVLCALEDSVRVKGAITVDKDARLLLENAPCAFEET